MTHSHVEQPSQSLIKLICYAEVHKVYTKATKWGCDHEKVACKDYISRQAKKHKNFRVSNSGLVIHPNHPHLGLPLMGLFHATAAMGVVFWK